MFRRVLVFLAVLALPGVMLAPVWRLYGLGAGEDDILYYFPMRTLFGELVRGGHWPWFNPWTGLGRPYLADPQTAVGYPFTWLFAVLPPLWAYAISLWAHYSLALWGAYRLLRELALDCRAALFGGVCFAFGGFLLAHRAHFALQHAAAWTPWVLFSLLRYTARTSGVGRAGQELVSSGSHAHVRRLVAAAVVIALQCFAGHVQIAALTALGSLLFVWSAAAGAGGSAAGPGLLTVTARWLAAWVCAAGLFAVQWVPTLAYLVVCTRTERTYADFVENSWHPVSVLGWTVPMLFGQRTPNFFDQPYWGPSHQVEQFSYAGILPLLLAALAIRSGWRSDPRRRPWVVLGGFGLLLALGQYGPICPLLYFVPGSNLFRCPARALLLVSLATAGLAAAALHELGVAATPPAARLRSLAAGWTQRPLLLGVALPAIPVVLVLLAVPFLDSTTRATALRAIRPWGTAVWVPLIVCVGSVYILHLVARRWRMAALAWLPVFGTLVDLGIMGWTIDVPQGVGEVQQLIAPQTAGWLEAVRADPHRLWVVTGRQGRLPGEYWDSVEKLVANTNILQHVETLTDYGPLHPRHVVGRFGFKPWGETDRAAELLAATGWMRHYDVGWVLLCDADRPPPTGCELWTTTPQGWRLYYSASAPGLACLESPAQPAAVTWETVSPTCVKVRVDTWPLRAEARAAPAESDDRESWPRLVLARAALPGWRARLADQELPIEAVDGVLMGVRIPPGEAVEVTWSYFPPGLFWGAGMSLACAAALIVARIPPRR